MENEDLASRWQICVTSETVRYFYECAAIEPQIDSSCANTVH